MFGIDSPELLVIAIVALFVIGPKELPGMLRSWGKWMAKARGMAAEFRRSFDEMARESELSELRKEIDNLKKNNPVSDLASSMAGVQAEVSSSMEAVSTAPAQETVAAEIVEPRSGEFAVTDSAPRPAPGA